MLHDRDGIFGKWLPLILEEFGAKSIKTEPQSPSQTSYYFPMAIITWAIQDAGAVLSSSTPLILTLITFEQVATTGKSLGLAEGLVSCLNWFL